MRVTLEKVSKNYDRQSIPALKDISVSIPSGQIMSLMGPSGSGKSTLLNMISTMDLPTSGVITLNGKELSQLKPWPLFRARFIGFVFQFHYLMPHLTLLENIELPMLVIEKSKKTRVSKARYLLDRVGLDHKRYACAQRISGGERQRAAIARSLANSPQLILADEPTGNVDTDTGLQIMSFMIDYCHEHATTLLVATHNPDIAQLAQRTIYLRDGRLVPEPFD